MKNLEIKASYKNHIKLRKFLKKIKARYVGELHQIDTYFLVPSGRLKLREVNNQHFELLYYRRDEESNQRWSNYYSYKVANPRELKNFLSIFLTIIVVVNKKRSLY